MMRLEFRRFAAGLPSGQGGFSILEMLIAFVIFSMAFGTLFTLFGQGVRLTVGNREYTVALHLAEDMLHREFVAIDDTPPSTIIHVIDEDITPRVAALYPDQLQNLPGLEVTRTVKPDPDLVSGGYHVKIAARWGSEQKSGQKRNEPRRQVELFSLKAVRH